MALRYLSLSQTQYIAKIPGWVSPFSLCLSDSGETTSYLDLAVFSLFFCSLFVWVLLSGWTHVCLLFSRPLISATLDPCGCCILELFRGVFFIYLMFYYYYYIGWFDFCGCRSWFYHYGLWVESIT